MAVKAHMIVPIVMHNVAECGTIGLIPVEASTMLGRIALQIVEAVFALAVYFLPAIVADRRKRHDLLTIALFNACIGWTLFGWFLALYWAFQPNPPPEIARDIKVKRRLLGMSAFSTALIARIERRAAKRDGVR
jgi:hypothetical protein